MKKKNAYNCARLIDKYLDGASIQWKIKGTSMHWEDIDTPSWDFVHNLYREKPELQENTPKVYEVPAKPTSINYMKRFITELKDHGPYLTDSFGNLYMPTVIDHEGITINDIFIPYVELAFSEYKFMDGQAI